MSCKNFKQQIFLYTELTSSEKSILEVHLHQCQDCCKLFQQINQQLADVNRLSSHVARVKNPERLTQKIIRAIEVAPKQSAPNNFLSLFDSLFLRFALSVVSMASLIFFVIELQRDMNPQAPQFDVAIEIGKPKIVLNTNSFLKVTRQNKFEKVTALSSLYSCIKSNHCDNSIVKKFKQKNLIIHEIL